LSQQRAPELDADLPIRELVQWLSGANHDSRAGHLRRGTDCRADRAPAPPSPSGEGSRSQTAKHGRGVARFLRRGRGMRWLVTGASGQLGAYVMRELVQRGFPVVAWSGSQAGAQFGIAW